MGVFYVILIHILTLSVLSITATSTKINVASKSISYYFNDQKIDMPKGYSTFEYQDRIYVPVRFIAENIGLEVTWKEDNTVDFNELFVRTPPVGNSAQQESKTEELIDAAFVQAKYVFNSTPVEMKDDFVTIMVNDRFYVPIRFVAEASGREIEWDEASQSVSIREANCNSGIYKFNGITYCFDYGQLIQSNNGINKWLCDGSSIQIYNNYIYYTSYQKRELWRMSLDGKDKILLETNVMSFYIDETGKMYRVKWDNKQRSDVIISDVLLNNEVKIKEQALIYFTLYYRFGYIYYLSNETGGTRESVKRMDMDGKNDTVIFTLPDDYYGCIFSDVNTIYYSVRTLGSTYFGAIYQYDVPRGISKRIYENDKMYDCKIDKNNLYYATENLNTGSILWKYDMDKQTTEKIYNTNGGFLIYALNETSILINENDVIYEIDRKTLQKKELLNIYIAD